MTPNWFYAAAGVAGVVCSFWAAISILQRFRRMDATTRSGESEALRFLRAIAAREKPFVSPVEGGSYVRWVDLTYTRVEINLTYFHRLKKWSYIVRERQSYASMYGDTVDARDAHCPDIAFLLDTYDLESTVLAWIAADRRLLAVRLNAVARFHAGGGQTTQAAVRQAKDYYLGRPGDVAGG